MKQIEIMNAAKKALLERFPQSFKDGNVHVVVFPVASPQNSDEECQIFPLGASFDAEGGGNLRRRQTFGVRIWKRVLSDMLSTHEQLFVELANRTRLAIKALHQHYEPELPMQEPFIVEGEATPRATNNDVGSYAYVDLTVRTALVSTIDELEED